MALVSRTCTLRDQCYYYLSVDTTNIIGIKQTLTHWWTSYGCFGYHSNSIKKLTPLFLASSGYNIKKSSAIPIFIMELSSACSDIQLYTKLTKTCKNGFRIFQQVKRKSNTMNMTKERVMRFCYMSVERSSGSWPCCLASHFLNSHWCIWLGYSVVILNLSLSCSTRYANFLYCKAPNSYQNKTVEFYKTEILL